MIDVQDLSLSYANRQILHGISCCFAGGSITAVVGQSGCGKSSFLKALNLIALDEGARLGGRILLDGTDTQKMPRGELRSSIAMLFQQAEAFPVSVERNIGMVLDYHAMVPRARRASRIQEVLQRVQLLDELNGNLRMNARKLSGGQQQRLALARCLAVEPRHILLDEPCSALDLKNTRAIENCLTDLAAGGCGIIIVTHNLAQARRIADTVILLDQGTIAEKAARDDFFERPSSAAAREQLSYL